MLTGKADRPGRIALNPATSRMERHPMYFASDNWAGVHPRIADHLLKASAGFVPAYGSSEDDKAMERRFSDLFERDVSVFYVSTGTAANALSLASLARTGGVVFAHEEAHVIADECGAPEFFAGSARICPVAGAYGKMQPDNLEAAIEKYPARFIHSGQPMAVTVTQATEAGTVYSLDELDAIAATAKKHGLPLHMDGARFANGLVALGCSPADMTWRRGVDILSFGGTKNGCWCAEAIVCFNPDEAKDLPFIRKRAAQLISKSRFVTAQFQAYFDQDLWLEMARHANRMADALRSGLNAAPTARQAWPTTANEVFAILKKASAEALRKDGATFYDWPTHNPDIAAKIAADETLVRLVTSFATTQQDVAAFISAV
jgi:threonine aldolase